MRPSQRPLGYGAVAQLIERVVRNDEVVGLIPICSTNLRQGERQRRQPTSGSAADGVCFREAILATDGMAIHLTDRDLTHRPSWPLICYCEAPAAGEIRLSSA